VIVPREQLAVVLGEGVDQSPRREKKCSRMGKAWHNARRNLGAPVGEWWGLGLNPQTGRMKSHAKTLTVQTGGLSFLIDGLGFQPQR
jgi:hypothetical protein